MVSPPVVRHLGRFVDLVFLAIHDSRAIAVCLGVGGTSRPFSAHTSLGTLSDALAGSSGDLASL